MDDDSANSITITITITITMSPAGSAANKANLILRYYNVISYLVHRNII